MVVNLSKPNLLNPADLKEQENALASLQRRVNGVFDEFYRECGIIPASESEAPPWLPPVDVTEDSARIYISVELPGVDRGDLNITLNGDVLTIRGNKSETRAHGSKAPWRRERIFGSFERQIGLPCDAQTDSIEAHFESGVLAISVLKQRVAQDHPKTIPVSA
jgi:HSP20 family protein